MNQPTKSPADALATKNGVLESELTEIKAKAARQEAEIQAHRLSNAKATVAAAVSRGAIAARDAKVIADWEKLITEDPDRGALLAKMPGNPAITSGRITGSANSRTIITAEAPNSVLRGYGAVLAKNAAIPMSADTAKEKSKLAREAAAIFAADIDRNPAFQSMNMEEAIQAADYSDASGNLGLLSGSLVMQKALPLMRYEYPMLSSITCDFSAEVGQLNQTQNTRIVLKPAVQTYDATPDTGGRPKGWITASPAQTVDVPVTLSDYVGVPIVFGAATLGSTARNLFEEMAPMAMYALAGYAVDKLTALMTPANFNAYAGTTVGTGATTSGSTTITVATTANMFPGQSISGTGIPANTYVASITNGTTAVLTQKATATNTGLTFTLGAGKVPTVYATYAKAQANWAVADLDSIAGAFDVNEVPMQDRFALLSSPYYRKLGSDSQVNALMTGTGNAEYLTDRKLPRLSGFDLQNAPYIPGSANRTGFAGHKAALILKTRLPHDLSGVLSGTAFPGSSIIVTDPATKLSVLLVQYINPTGNFAEWRPEVMLGAAVGERRAGMIITSA